MRVQGIETKVNEYQVVRVWNDKNGCIKYKIDGGEQKTLKQYVIRESIHDYYVSPTEDRLTKLYKGTKTNCLYWLAGYIGMIINICRGKQ